MNGRKTEKNRKREGGNGLDRSATSHKFGPGRIAKLGQKCSDAEISQFPTVQYTFLLRRVCENEGQRRNKEGKAGEVMKRESGKAKGQALLSRDKKNERHSEERIRCFMEGFSL